MAFWKLQVLPFRCLPGRFPGFTLFENAGAVASAIEAGLKSLKRERYQGNRKAKAKKSRRLR
jgi:hypothetical protein